MSLPQMPQTLLSSALVGKPSALHKNKKHRLTWRIEPPKIDRLLSSFCYCVKFMARVNVGFRIRIRVRFRVRIRVGFRNKINLMFIIDSKKFQNRIKQKINFWGFSSPKYPNHRSMNLFGISKGADLDIGSGNWGN